MKNTKKVLLGGVAALALVGTSVFGTYMYLTSTKTVENTFSVGKVIIDLNELDTDNDNNKADNTLYEIIGEDGKITETRDRANAYHLYPNHTYVKDPTVWVDSNSEDCYLFVTVDNGIEDIEATSVDGGYQNIKAQMVKNGWAVVDATKNLYVYVGNEGTLENPTVVKARENKVVFKEFKISSTVDNTTLSSYGDAKITVNAYAVQADGFESETAANIFNTAFPSTSND